MAVKELIKLLITGTLPFNSTSTDDSTIATTSSSMDMADMSDMPQSNIKHGSSEIKTRLHIAHGVIATSVIVLFFPSVAIVLRLIRSPSIVTIHKVLQLMNLCLLLVAFVLGVSISYVHEYWWSYPHQIFGTITVVLFLFQPILGIMQHRHFLRTGVRSYLTHLHIWYGRGLIIMGIINGVLGLDWANDSKTGIRAIYWIVAIAMVLSYIGAQVWYHRQRQDFIKRHTVTQDAFKGHEEEKMTV